MRYLNENKKKKTMLMKAFSLVEEEN